jgi:hypothetical protein
MFRNLQRSAYNGFDPSLTQGRRSNWDPSVAGRYNNSDGTTAGVAGSAGQNVVAASQGQKMQVNVSINNPNATTAVTIEMFNWLTSFTRILNSTYATGNYLMIPLLTYAGLARTIAGTGGTVGFQDDGNLQIHGNDAATPPDAILTVGCQEVGYSSFFEASSISPFQVAYFRYTVNTDAQIDNTIKWQQKTFSGGVTQNVISPRAYFKPTQFQNFVIDITVAFTIGLDSGLFVTANATENLRFSLFIEMWTVQGIGQA